MADISINLEVDQRKLQSNLNNVQGKFNKLGQGLGKTLSKIGGLALKVGSILGTIATGFAAKNIFQLTAEYEKYNAVLTNTFQNQVAATQAMSLIQKVAASTPFQVNKLTESYVKLANRGLALTEKQLINVGDVAASTGKDFDQLTEAILDVNNQERWKEFGITVKTEGNKVKLTYKGITKEVNRSVKGALSAVEAFGKMKGVAGGMDAVSKTLGGKWSNLVDTF